MWRRAKVAVAPHTGARIETRARSAVELTVAPHTRARIETPGRPTQRPLRSPLTQGRGSKPHRPLPTASPHASPLTQGRGSKPRGVERCGCGVVAPHTRARIETFDARTGFSSASSSPLTQGRGSKLVTTTGARTRVAPHTGARIETMTRQTTLTAPVAPHTGARIETTRCRAGSHVGESPVTHGRGSKPMRYRLWPHASRRPSHTGADRKRFVILTGGE